MINPFQEIHDRLSNLERLLQGLHTQKNNIPLSQEELLSKKQTCALLGISHSTLWRWTQKKVINAYGLENRVYYKRSEIMAAVKKIN